jgi:Transposase DDE domain
MLPTADSILPPLTSDDGLTQIETFLQEAIADLVPDLPASPGRGRPRILPSLCLWLGLTVCILRGKRHQRDLWRLLAQGGLWSYPRFALSDQAIYSRLEREGLRPMQTLFAQVTQVLVERLTPYADPDLAPFASEVVALDETTLEQITRRLPPLRDLPNGDPGLVAGTVAGVFDVRRQLWRCVQYRADWQQNEKVLARDLVADLPPGSLILADLGYFGFAWFDELTDAGHCWVSRIREKTSVERRWTYYQDETTWDGVIWLGTYRADRAKHAVRLVEFTVGTTRYRYLTNVLDPHRLSLRAIAGLYQRRWDIELAVKTVKRQLGVHLLWSSKPVVIQQQVLATLILAQILHALRLEIAGRAGVDPFEVSLELFIRYLPDFVAQGHDPIEAFLTNARAVGFIRPSTRTQNRAPHIDPATIRPLPPDLVLVRIPRYAERNCGPRHDRDTPRRN